MILLLRICIFYSLGFLKPDQDKFPNLGISRVLGICKCGNLTGNNMCNPNLTRRYLLKIGAKPKKKERFRTSGTVQATLFGQERAEVDTRKFGTLSHIMSYDWFPIIKRGQITTR